MRLARRPGVVMAAAVLLAVACGKGGAADPGDDAIHLPERSPEDGGREAATSPPDSGQGSPTDSGADGGSGSPQLCAAPDLLLCFAFEGDVKDGSPNALAPTSVQGVTFIAGKVGQAAQLSAASFIRYASAPLLTVPASTVEAWVRPAQVLAESVIFDADERYAMTALPDGSLQCNTTNVVVKGGALPLGTWTHAACVFDGTKVRVYVGGVLTNSADGKNGLIPTAPASAAIGGNAPTGQPFVGAIDSFRVFKVARTAAQIAAAASP